MVNYQTNMNLSENSRMESSEVTRASRPCPELANESELTVACSRHGRDARVTQKHDVRVTHIGHLSPARCRAFTLIELCLGLVITALVMSALSAFSLAMSTAWKNASQSQAITLVGNQAVFRTQKEVSNAKIIGAVRAGSMDASGSGAAVLLWAGDTNNDGYIQLAEIEMIEFDPANHVLQRYAAGHGDASSRVSWAVFTDPALFDNFKVGRTAQPMARNVYGAVFQTSGTSGSSAYPSLKFALKLAADSTAGQSGMIGSDPQVFVQYGTATVRAPLAQPNY